MCGIFFFYSKKQSTSVEDWMISLASTELNNRGPDYSSIQISSNKDILLVNSVLSINQGSSYQDFPVLNSDEFFGFNGNYITSDYDHKYSGSDTLYVLNSARKEFDIESFMALILGMFSFVQRSVLAMK